MAGAMLILIAAVQVGDIASRVVYEQRRFVNRPLLALP